MKMTPIHKPVRVLLADDHAVLRSGLRLLIESQEDFKIVGEASSGLAVLALAEELRPDIILLDLSMPGMSGLDALQALKKLVPETKTLVLTMHEDPQYFRQALSDGAAGYIIKKAADTELLSAMRAIMGGGVYVHPSLTRYLLDDTAASSNQKDLWDKLSGREQQVLRLVAFGHTSTEIAEELGLSSKTVDTYRSRGMEKLELKTRAALVRFALLRGLLDP
jgi:two-component system response regulator NreC